MKLSVREMATLVVIPFSEMSSTFAFINNVGRIAFVVLTHRSPCTPRGAANDTNWFTNILRPFLPEAMDADSLKEQENIRRMQYPEQYPATYEMNEISIDEDRSSREAQLVRPLLKQTQLESRPLKIIYDARKDGWSAASFHGCVDSFGAAVVLGKTKSGAYVGGYNPKGWASTGGARPSVAAFLFYEKFSQSKDGVVFQKLRKVGGGGLACSFDEPNYGIAFGPDALVINLQQPNPQVAKSKLGPYYEQGPDELSSILSSGREELIDLKILVGRYEKGEDIPYSGAVLDMTSG